MNPATKKNNIKEIIDNKTKSVCSAPFNKVNVQLTTFMVAGIEIIIVIVLYSALLR
ncbi:MAG: hypothetical protein KDH96_06415 [Candidatus Riesia sp.]|nr:hypothetical protein [Candidatus Riesia sp.]